MRMSGRDLTLKNGIKVQMRTVRPNEARSYLQFIQSVYTNNDLLELNADEVEDMKAKALKKEIADYENSKRQIMLGIYHNGRMVGNCTIARVSDLIKQSHRATLKIAVVKEYRGIGLGSTLMKLALDFAGKVAYEQFEVDVLEGNTSAFILCREYGFEALGRYRRAYKSMKGNYQDSILLVKHISNNET